MKAGIGFLLLSSGLGRWVKELYFINKNLAARQITVQFQAETKALVHGTNLAS